MTPNSDLSGPRGGWHWAPDAWPVTHRIGSAPAAHVDQRFPKGFRWAIVTLPLLLQLRFCVRLSTDDILVSFIEIDCCNLSAVHSQSETSLVAPHTFDFAHFLRLIERLKSTLQFSEFKRRIGRLQLELWRRVADQASASTPQSLLVEHAASAQAEPKAAAPVAASPASRALTACASVEAAEAAVIGSLHLMTNGVVRPAPYRATDSIVVPGRLLQLPCRDAQRRTPRHTRHLQAKQRVSARRREAGCGAASAALRTSCIDQRRRAAARRLLRPQTARTASTAQIGLPLPPDGQLVELLHHVSSWPDTRGTRLRYGETEIALLA